MLLLIAGCATAVATRRPYGALACVAPPPRTPPEARCLDTSQLTAVARAHRDEVARCIDASHNADPDAPRQTVRLTWEIRPDGTPVRVGYIDCGDPVFGECMASAVATWQFPACATSTPAVVFPFAY